MAQIFSKRANNLFRGCIVVFFVMAVGACGLTYAIWWSPYLTRVNVTIDQPVPFSHQHHVSGLGIDCRYCHNTVETASAAGMPATEVCMTCHSQVWTEAPVLKPVRESFRTGTPLEWTRIYDLPEYVYFNHSIHVSKGIACVECHGQVDEMPLTYKAQDLYMKTCLECHRHPERFVRPRDEIFAVHNPTGPGPAHNERLAERYHIQTHQLTDCSICHR